MRHSLMSRIVLVVLVNAALIPACNQPKLTGPSALAINGIEIVGPSTIDPGRSAQFVAKVRLDDGTVKLAPTADVRWKSSNTSVLQVTAAGGRTTNAKHDEA